jgi:hypothetical protein
MPLDFTIPTSTTADFALRETALGSPANTSPLFDVLSFLSGKDPDGYDWPDLAECRPDYDPRWMRLRVLMPWLDLSISHSGRYYHKNSYTLEHSLMVNREYPRLEKMLADFISDTLENFRERLCDAIYQCLESSYDAALETENLEELADVNGYTFLANGDRFDA